jgi:hypothetical protein
MPERETIERAQEDAREAVSCKGAVQCCKMTAAAGA